MFSLKLKELRENSGLSQKAFSQKLGVSQSTVGMWESNKREPGFETTKKIADFFGVSTDYLLGRERRRNVPEMFGKEDITYMKVIGTVKAGYGGVAYEEHTGETTPVPKAFFRGKDRDDFFVLRISGNSMYPKLLDGDLVLVERMKSVNSGDIAVVMYGDEEATVKTIKFEFGYKWIDLIPANPEYETKHFEGKELEDFCILGKVVKLFRDL